MQLRRGTDANAHSPGSALVRHARVEDLHHDRLGELNSELDEMVARKDLLEEAWLSAADE